MPLRGKEVAPFKNILAEGSSGSDLLKDTKRVMEELEAELYH